MYLHKNVDVFQSLIVNASEYTGKDIIIVEKDYYITLILRMLSESHENCVFKGGTSLSKGYKIIDRFSEDVDITFDEHIGKKRRKKLKYETIKAISDALNLPVENFDETESNRDLNSYHFRYHSVFNENASFLLDTIPEYVKVETSLGSYAFPTETRQIGSFIGDYLKFRERTDLISQFHLEEFSMKLQSINRTYIDKIFASCDYYLCQDANRRSRHLYDIYKLTPLITFNLEFYNLFEQVRSHRYRMNQRELKRRRKPICPSAEPNINVSEIIRNYCQDNFYEMDYLDITDHFINDYVSYSDIIKQMLEIADKIQ